jgi:NTE family protein
MSLKVGLVLGGGGARGIAHIAYLNALDELDIKPDVIAGTGIGALVGGLYASGKSPNEIVELLEEIDYRKSMKILNNYTFKDGKYGVLDYVGLEEYLELVMPVKIFDRLYTPLKVVAADYETQEQHVFEDGNVVSAIRASIAVPGIFSPVEVDEAFYIDGGCVNPLPIDVIKDECDVVIAIDVTGKGADSEIGVASTANDLAQCYQILTKTLLVEKSKNNAVDIMAKPELEGVQMLDVFNFENILDAVDDEVEDFKYDVAKLLKPELLEKAGKKAKKTEAVEEVEELEVEEEIDEEIEEYEDDDDDDEQYDDDETALADENEQIAAQIAALEAKLNSAQAPKVKPAKKAKKAKPAKKAKVVVEENQMTPRQAKRAAKKEALARLEEEILRELEQENQ